MCGFARLFRHGITLTMGWIYNDAMYRSVRHLLEGLSFLGVQSLCEGEILRLRIAEVSRAWGKDCKPCHPGTILVLRGIGI